MKRCPACGTEYSVAQGFCPMDGAPLAEDGAAPSAAAWDPPRTTRTTAEARVVPPVQPPAPVSMLAPVPTAPTTTQRGRPGDLAAVIPSLTAGPVRVTASSAFIAPGTRPAAFPTVSGSADTGTALVPPMEHTPRVGGPGHGVGLAAAAERSPAARTVMAMVPPAGARPGGAGVLSSLDAPRPTPVGDPLAGDDDAPTLLRSGGASGLAQVPSSPAVPAEGVQVDGAFFPAGGISRARPDPLSLPTWEESLVGRVLDQRYRIEACIGAGAMGVVFKATHVIIDKPLAIKMLRSDVASQPDIVKRFLLEAQLASRVKHPNVVDISDYGQIAGQTAYYVMEYLNGSTLSHRIDSGGRLEPALAVEIATQMAQALQAAHGSKIIHRDLKSENIFLCERADGGDPQVKILDFGIARIRDKKTRLTAMGALIGTPAYMSPEQAQGQEADERSDLYALGVILFEMLAGRVPFKAPTVAMILSAQIFDAPPTLKEVEPNVPDLPNIEHLIQMLLAKNRDERPQTAAEVVHLLKTAAEVDLGAVAAAANGSLSGKRRATVTIGSWSVAENNTGLVRVEPGAPASAVGEARTTPRPEPDAVTSRQVSASGRIQRRPSVIVPSGTPVERFAAPPGRGAVTGEMEHHRPYPTGVAPAVRSAGPPMILIVAAAASIGAAITVTLYKQVWRRTPAPVVQPVEQPAPPPEVAPAMNRLTFESDPAGATVVAENGDLWGVTPFTRELVATAPRTRVVFRLPGHDDASLDISPADSARHKVHLRPTPAVAPAPAVDPAAVVPVEPPPTKAEVPAKQRPAAKKPAGAPAEAKTEAPSPPPPAEEDSDMGELKNPFRKK